MHYKKNKKTINNCEPLKKWFWSFIVVIAICVFSYGYLVRSTIVNIVARQNTEKELSNISTRVLDLEKRYIKVKNNVTPELAKELGFITPESQKFVVRNTNTPELSLITAGN